jgi:hypothetical protein
VSALARPRQDRGHRLLRALVTIAFVVLVFLLGIAFARTLDERPKSSGVATTERTLTPLPQSAPARTVTVTVTGP